MKIGYKTCKTPQCFRIDYTVKWQCFGYDELYKNQFHQYVAFSLKIWVLSNFVKIQFTSCFHWFCCSWYSNEIKRQQAAPYHMSKKSRQARWNSVITEIRIGGERRWVFRALCYLKGKPCGQFYTRKEPHHLWIARGKSGLPSSPTEGNWQLITLFSVELCEPTVVQMDGSLE